MIHNGSPYFSECLLLFTYLIISRTKKAKEDISLDRLPFRKFLLLLHTVTGKRPTFTPWSITKINCYYILFQ